MRTGQFPQCGLGAGYGGNLYGTTNTGVSRQLSGSGAEPCSRLDPSGTFTVLHSLGSPGGLVMDGAGNLYGSTSEGIFKLDPATGTFTMLDSNAASGATLALDAAGNLYGTTVPEQCSNWTHRTYYHAVYLHGAGGRGCNPRGCDPGPSRQSLRHHVLTGAPQIVSAANNQR